MKFALFACLGLLSNVGQSSIFNIPQQQPNCIYPQWFNPKNYVQNGDFENTHFPKGRQVIYTGDFPGWWAKKGEVGFGKLYNPNWNPHTKVAELDADNSSTTKLISKFHLKDRRYTLIFRYAARAGVKLESSKFSIKFNGHIIQTITPHNYKINCLNINLSGKEGENELIFIEQGKNDGLGSTIDDVIVTQYQNVNNPFFYPYHPNQSDFGYGSNLHTQLTKLGQNQIINGNFQSKRIPSNKTWIIVGDFPGWWVKNGQIGLGKNYNPGWNPKTQVIQLDANQNTVYKTDLKLNHALYVFQFDWAARKGHPLQTSKFQIQFNGHAIFNGNPYDYNLNHELLVVDANQGNNWIKLIGQGKSDSLGATLDNLSLREIIYY